MAAIGATVQQLIGEGLLPPPFQHGGIRGCIDVVAEICKEPARQTPVHLANLARKPHIRICNP